MPAIVNDTEVGVVLVPNQDNDAIEVERVPLTAAVVASMSLADLLGLWGVFVRLMGFHKIFRALRKVLEQPVFRTPETAGDITYPRTCDSCCIHLPRASFTAASIEIVDLCAVCFDTLSECDARDFRVDLNPSTAFLGEAPAGCVRLPAPATFCPATGAPCIACGKTSMRHCFRAPTTDQIQCVRCYMQIERLVASQDEIVATIQPALEREAGTASGQFYYDLFRGVVDWDQVVHQDREQFAAVMRDAIDPRELREIYGIE